MSITNITSTMSNLVATEDPSKAWSTPFAVGPGGQPVALAAVTNISHELRNGGSAAQGATPTSLLAEPMPIGGNIVIDLAMLMCKSNEQDRNDSVQLEDTANRAAAQDDAQRVQQLQDKASQDSAEAWAEGLSEIAGGAAAIAGAGFSATSTQRAALGGVSTASPGIGKLFGAGYKAAADHDDADAAKFQAQADADVRRYDRASGNEQAAAQSIQQVQQYLQAILQTQQATNSAATGYRG
jgi:hypothetical protein